MHVDGESASAGIELRARSAGRVACDARPETTGSHEPL